MIEIASELSEVYLQPGESLLAQAFNFEHRSGLLRGNLVLDARDWESAALPLSFAEMAAKATAP